MSKGMFGRIAPAESGSIFVRDQDAARAKAIQEAVERFEAAGVEVPEHLTGLAESAGEAGEDVVSVDADEWTVDSSAFLGGCSDCVVDGEVPAAAVVEPAVELEAEVVEAEVVEAEVVEEPAAGVEVVEAEPVEVEVVEEPAVEEPAEAEVSAPVKRGRPKKAQPR